MEKEQIHPAALTSKTLLAEALIKVLYTKDYKDITITEVCALAQVARRTFYRNFDLLDDVLNFYLTNIMTQFKTHMHTFSTDAYAHIVTAYFSFWKQHTNLLSLLNQRGLYYLIFMQYIKLLPEMPFLFNRHHVTDLDEKLFTPTMAFNAGGLWSLLTYWITTSCTQSPEELAQIVLLR